MICQVVNEFGKRCRSKAVGTHNYHGAVEYKHRPGCSRWVRVSMCRKHLKAVE